MPGIEPIKDTFARDARTAWFLETCRQHGISQIAITGEGNYAKNTSIYGPRILINSILGIISNKSPKYISNKLSDLL